MDVARRPGGVALALPASDSTFWAAAPPGAPSFYRVASLYGAHDGLDLEGAAGNGSVIS